MKKKELFKTKTAALAEIKIKDYYTTIKKAEEKPDDFQQFILDCIDLRILKGDKKSRKEFEEIYEAKYPITIGDLTPKLIRDLEETLRSRRRQRDFEERMKRQRYEKGYSECDVWNFHYWLAEMCGKMLEELAKIHHGHPLIDYDGNPIKDVRKYEEKYDGEKIDTKWKEILERMSFLAKELNEETCTMAPEKDRLLDVWGEIRREYEVQYGTFGEKLKPQEVLQREKEEGYIEMWGPEHSPDKEYVRRYKAAWKELSDYEKKMFRYQNKCKDEFFALLKKYYWNLWD